MRYALDVAIKTCVELDDVIPLVICYADTRRRAMISSRVDAESSTLNSCSFFLTRIRIHHNIEKCFLVVRDLLILNQADVLSTMFDMGRRKYEWLRKDVLGIGQMLFACLFDDFVLFRTEDDGIGSKDFLRIQFFQPLDST